MSKKLLAVFAAAFLMTACRQAQTVETETQRQSAPPESQKSDILTLLEKNGAGDASKSSLAAFRRWFALRPALAEQVGQMCQPIEGNATVAWGDSAEAAACSAAHEATIAARRAKALTFVPITPDRRAW